MIDKETTMRVTGEQAQRAEALVPSMKHLPELRRARRLSRSAVLKLALEAGLAALEELYKGRPVVPEWEVVTAARATPTTDARALAGQHAERMTADALAVEALAVEAQERADLTREEWMVQDSVEGRR